MKKNKIRIRHTAGSGFEKYFSIEYSLSFGIVWHKYYKLSGWYMTKEVAEKEMDKLTLSDILAYRAEQKEERKLQRQKWIEESTKEQIESESITRALK